MSDVLTTSSPPTDGYKRLWAKSKPRHPLWKHMQDASAVSLALPSFINNFGWEPRAIACLVGLHDVGKADPCFQHQIPDFSDELAQAGYPVTGDARCRHERISAGFVKNKLIADGLERVAADAVSRAVVAHHGYWIETARPVGQQYAKAQNQLCRMLQQVLDVKAFPSDSPSDLSAFGMRLAGHIVLCDWIASNEAFFGDARLQDVNDPEGYFAKTKDVAVHWVRELGLERSDREGKAGCVVAAARPIQQTLLDKDIPPGLVIIEAPMGEGKTEAAWILAEKWRGQGYRGMYMALPTMATSDCLYGRYRDDYLKRLGHGENAKLVHGMAWLRDEKEPEKLPENGEPGDDQSFAAAWFRPTRRAMLAAHGVGTVDQAMLAGMHVKFGFLRLYGLADRVLVIDEVHAYDAYMSAIIARLLQWCACLKIPVVVLSATLSAKQRAGMIEAYGAMGGDPGPKAPYPLITVAEAGKEAQPIEADASSSRTLKMQTHPGLLGDAKKTAAKAVELVKDGGCCCVILNTVKQAQAVYEALTGEREGKKSGKKGTRKAEDTGHLLKDEVLLFHARFTAADRERITNEVLAKFGKDTANRPPKFVLVATQVVEQSLDVDFDHMISEIAPIDLLLQRSGRIKRHSRDRNGKLVDGLDQRGEPVLHVLLPATEKKEKGAVKNIDKPDFRPSEFIYQRYPLLRTLDVLRANSSNVKLPDKFRPLIEAVYSDDLQAGASDDLKEAKQEWDDLQEDLAAQAGQFLLCEPMADEFDPVGADEVGDDSDDGNGWRARTRLGLEDVLAIPINDGNVAELARGELARDQLKDLYRQSVKFPAWLWPLRADAKLPEAERKKRQPALGERRLRGVWLLPVNLTAGGWMWSGERRLVKSDGKQEWKPIAFKYGNDKGLQEVENKPKDGGGE